MWISEITLQHFRDCVSREFGGWKSKLSFKQRNNMDVSWLQVKQTRHDIPARGRPQAAQYLRRSPKTSIGQCRYIQGAYITGRQSYFCILHRCTHHMYTTRAILRVRHVLIDIGEQVRPGSFHGLCRHAQSEPYSRLLSHDWPIWTQKILTIIMSRILKPKPADLFSMKKLTRKFTACLYTLTQPQVLSYIKGKYTQFNKTINR